MNGDTLSFDTSIKCVQHISLANAPLIKSYGCRERNFIGKQVCHAHTALLFI